MTFRIHTWLPLIATVGSGGWAAYETLSNDPYAVALKNVPRSSPKDAVVRGNQAPYPPAAHPEQNVGAATPKPDTFRDGTTRDGSVQRVSIQSNPEDFVALDTSFAIYPGALLQGKSLSTTPEPIIAKRRPGTMTVSDVIGVETTKSVDVDGLSLANAVTAQSKIVAELEKSGHSIPANFYSKIGVFEKSSPVKSSQAIQQATFRRRRRARCTPCHRSIQQ